MPEPEGSAAPSCTSPLPWSANDDLLSPPPNALEPPRLVSAHHVQYTSYAEE